MAESKLSWRGGFRNPSGAGRGALPAGAAGLALSGVEVDPGTRGFAWTHPDRRRPREPSLPGGALTSRSVPAGSPRASREVPAGSQSSRSPCPSSTGAKELYARESPSANRAAPSPRSALKGAGAVSARRISTVAAAKPELRKTTA